MVTSGAWAELSPAEAKVWVVLAKRADGSGICNPGIATIAREAGMSDRHARDQIARLGPKKDEEDKEDRQHGPHVSFPRGRQGGYRESDTTIYQLHLPTNGGRIVPGSGVGTPAESFRGLDRQGGTIVPGTPAESFRQNPFVPHKTTKPKPKGRAQTPTSTKGGGCREGELRDGPSGSDSGRSAARQRFRMDVSHLWGSNGVGRGKHPTGSQQWNSDDTSTDRLFDMLWPRGADPKRAGALVQRALDEITPKAGSKDRPMAWLTRRVEQFAAEGHA